MYLLCCEHPDPSLPRELSISHQHMCHSGYRSSLAGRCVLKCRSVHVFVIARCFCSGSDMSLRSGLTRPCLVQRVTCGCMYNVAAWDSHRPQLKPFSCRAPLCRHSPSGLGGVMVLRGSGSTARVGRVVVPPPPGFVVARRRCGVSMEHRTRRSSRSFGH